MTQTNKRAYAPRPQPRGAAPQGRPVQRPPQQGRPAPRPQSRRPAPARPGYAPRNLQPTSRMRELLLILVVGAAACIAALLMQKAWPNGFPLKAGDQSNAVGKVTEIHSSGPLRINEVMTTNRKTLLTADGTSPDWIEVMNVGGSAVNLSGYALSKNSDSANVFTFPDYQLEAGQGVLIYADSKLREDAGEEFHAPFRLSSVGDTLMLFNPAGTAIDTVNIPPLHLDSSYARISTNGWEESYMPTPGVENTEEAYRALAQPAADSPVVVSEIVSTNRTTLADANGQYYDYIELYNRSNEAVDLTGWYLSDDVDNARKWRFPQLSLSSGEYLVVFASKLDRTEDTAQLHTNFALSSEGERVVLSNAAGRVMDRVDFDLLKADVAWSRTQDGSFTASLAPTPGRANQ